MLEWVLQCHVVRPRRKMLFYTFCLLVYWKVHPTQAAGTHQHQILLAVFALSRMHWPGTTKRFVMPVGEPTWLVRLSAPAPTPRAPVTSGSRLPPSALPPPAGALPPTPAPPVAAAELESAKAAEAACGRSRRKQPAATVRLSGRVRGSARSNMVKNSWDGAPTSCKTIRGSRLHTS
jgi:hypothetical protein